LILPGTGEIAVTESVFLAAPLLIAAVLMAVRFVGCTQDFGAFEGAGGEDGKPPDGEGVPRAADLGGEGTLSVVAVPAHDPTTTPFTGAGVHTYDIPPWCTDVDLILLGAGGGGAGNVGGLTGAGGVGGSWMPVTVQRGAEIPSATTSITVTVGSGGSGGSGGSAATDGGDTTATAAGMSPQSASGGTQGASTSQTTGMGPGDESYLGTTYQGGADQTSPGAPGNNPGGGGAGGGSFGPGGGAGADGAAWIVARQT
jgi:hypothetical protein